ncbi:MAG: phenylalanine--tRNA ligase subunit beta, partial [Caulobacterales bacterium]
MKFTLSWLKDHLDTSASLDAIVDALTMTGTEVESVTDPAARLAAFSVAHVLEAEKHPNADKLQVGTVATQDGEKRSVCGAPNARAGMKTIYAPIGAYVPGLGVTLEKRPVRGVDSEGMLCSAKELEAGTDSDGILDLTGDWAVGTPAAQVLGADDPVIDVEITPNRPDCLGVAGIARDLAAAGLGALTDKPIAAIKGSFPCPIKIEIDAPDACPVFAGRFMRGVKNGPSPEWLRKRLEAVGLRPISALVDITNLISLDRARPLHVYDATKLSGAIRARLGRDGEALDALDGKIYAINADMCVIADDKQALGLGGVMGGTLSGVTDATTEIFIESAYFDPARTRRTG